MAKVELTVNGKKLAHEVEDRTLLADFLRDTLGLTGTHIGCDTSQCGCCTIHLNGKAVKSCTMLAIQASGSDVRTIEGLASVNKDGVETLHPVQQAWLAEDVPQCGYCQSGQIMSAADLLKTNPKPTREQIVEHMSTNICRCGTYQRIVRAVERASKEA